MDGSNLGLERVVDKAMAGKRRLFLELRRHDDGLEHLAAAACGFTVSFRLFVVVDASRDGYLTSRQCLHGWLQVSGIAWP